MCPWVADHSRERSEGGLRLGGGGPVNTSHLRGEGCPSTHGHSENPGWFFPRRVSGTQPLGVGLGFAVHEPGRAEEGLTVTDGDPPHHLGPLAKLSGLRIGEQPQVLIEFVCRHYRAGAARRGSRAPQDRSEIQYSSPVAMRAVTGVRARPGPSPAPHQRPGGVEPRAADLRGPTESIAVLGLSWQSARRTGDGEAGPALRGSPCTGEPTARQTVCRLTGPLQELRPLPRASAPAGGGRRELLGRQHGGLPGPRGDPEEDPRAGRRPRRARRLLHRR